MVEDLKLLIGPDERIIYEGKPNKKCFIFEGIFNPLLPVAIVWGLIDFSIIIASIFMGAPGEVKIFMIPFMLIHMMPIWIYLGGIFTIVKKYTNLYYIITDKAIYKSSGIISKRLDHKPFAELSHVDLHVGFFDQKFGVGDIICTSANSSGSITIESVSDYQTLYTKVKKLQLDIYTDVMYPNDLRPSENNGYKTEYKG